ncbi:hypothetical protein BH23PLA1_BH23PLA1_03830 [soil metagenome]
MPRVEQYGAETGASSRSTRRFRSSRQNGECWRVQRAKSRSLPSGGACRSCRSGSPRRADASISAGRCNGSAFRSRSCTSWSPGSRNSAGLLSPGRSCRRTMRQRPPVGPIPGAQSRSRSSSDGSTHLPETPSRHFLQISWKVMPTERIRSRFDSPVRPAYNPAGWRVAPPPEQMRGLRPPLHSLGIWRPAEARPAALLHQSILKGCGIPLAGP